MVVPVHARAFEVWYPQPNQRRYIFHLFLLQYNRVRELQRKSHTHYFYEATVGAGLPVISTLRSLVETGDKIVKVEGVFRSVSR
jgi:hypothetical protein